MNYKIYKLHFSNGVHFGKNNIEDSECTFSADVLFSALCQEAIKVNEETLNRLVEMAKNGRILLSDAFPYIGDNYYIPKPAVKIIAEDNDLRVKKAFKSLKYIPIHMLDTYLKGKLDVVEEKRKFNEEFGKAYIKTSAVIDNDETIPYKIGVFQYKKDSGLYILMGYEFESEVQLIEELLISLSYAGIGGRKSSGLGRFEIDIVTNIDKKIYNRLTNTGKSYITLSTSLPREDELENSLVGAKYTLVKKSGFISSYTYSDEFIRKKDMYMFASGACIVNKYNGDVYDVSLGGRHPVYRYGKPMFMEVGE